MSIKAKINKVNNLPYIVFIALLSDVISVINFTKDLITKHTDLSQFQTYMNMDYFEISLRTLTVFFVFFLWRKLLKDRSTLVDKINKDNKHWFDQLQYVSRVSDNKFLFLYYQQKSIRENATPEQFEQMLTEVGFSIENLNEIGLNDQFIMENEHLLFTEKTMKKYREFKKSLTEEIVEKNTERK